MDVCSLIVFLAASCALFAVCVHITHSASVYWHMQRVKQTARELSSVAWVSAGAAVALAMVNERHHKHKN